MTDLAPGREQLAGAFRAAAYACEGDCGLTEQECHTAHPIQIAAPSGDVVTAPVDVLAEAVLPLVEDMRAAAVRQAWVEAADFLRDGHFRDGLSVQEIGTAMRHRADAVVASQDPPRPSTCVCGSTIRSLPHLALIHYAECPARTQGDLYFCPTVGEIESKKHGGFDACCEHPEKHVDMPDVPGVQAISEYLSEKATIPARDQDEATAEYHTVDGLRYLCHRDDHYCPTSEQNKETSP